MALTGQSPLVPVNDGRMGGWAATWKEGWMHCGGYGKPTGGNGMAALGFSSGDGRTSSRREREMACLSTCRASSPSFGDHSINLLSLCKFR